jgi:hypothetical protein
MWTTVGALMRGLNDIHSLTVHEVLKVEMCSAFANDFEYSNEYKPVPLFALSEFSGSLS